MHLLKGSALVAVLLCGCGPLSDKSLGSLQASGLNCRPETRVAYGDFFSAYSAVTVGEMHGANEMPYEFSQIVKTAMETHPSKKIVIAVEHDRSLQEKYDAIELTQSFEENQLDFDFLNTHDGRSSKAMKKMLWDLLRLQRNNPNLEVQFVDITTEEAHRVVEGKLSFPEWVPINSSGETISEKFSIGRDAIMGLNSLSACDDFECDLLIYYAGNIHTQIRMGFGGYWDAVNSELVKYEKAPAGYIIALQNDATASIDLKHRGGHMYNLNSGGKMEAIAWKPSTSNFMLEDHEPYCLGGHNFSISVGAITAAAN